MAWWLKKVVRQSSAVKAWAERMRQIKEEKEKIRLADLKAEQELRLMRLSVEKKKLELEQLQIEDKMDEFYDDEPAQQQAASADPAMEFIGMAAKAMMGGANVRQGDTGGAGQNHDDPKRARKDRKQTTLDVEASVVDDKAIEAEIDALTDEVKK